MQELTYSLAPDDWALCFLHDCPLAEACLRHAVGLLAPPSLTRHAIVMPGARQGGQCCLFASKEPVRMARGMRHLLCGLPPEKVMALRHALYDIFGSQAQYYRYRNGRYAILPEQQERVAQLFRMHGIDCEPDYDTATLEYYFP